jgi:hypothetical protein
MEQEESRINEKLKGSFKYTETKIKTMLLFQFLDDSNDNYIEIGEWMELEGCVIKSAKISEEQTEFESSSLKSKINSPVRLPEDFSAKAEQLSALKKSESKISEYFDFGKKDDLKLAFQTMEKKYLSFTDFENLLESLDIDAK